MPINKSTQQGYLGTIPIREGIFDMYEQEFIEFAEFIGTSSNNRTTNVTDISFAVPSGSQSGDFAVAMLSGGGGANQVGDWANSQGFTSLYENVLGEPNGAIFYKILDGTEGANFTFTTDNACKLSGEIVVYRGTNSILSSSENIEGGNTTRTATSITASENSILFAFFNVNGDNRVFSNPPSDLTLLRTYSNSHKHNYWIGYKTVTTSGPTGNYTITVDGGQGESFLFTI